MYTWLNRKYTWWESTMSTILRRSFLYWSLKRSITSAWKAQDTSTWIPHKSKTYIVFHYLKILGLFEPNLPVYYRWIILQLISSFRKGSGLWCGHGLLGHARKIWRDSSEARPTVLGLLFLSRDSSSNGPEKKCETVHRRSKWKHAMLQFWVDGKKYQ